MDKIFLYQFTDPTCVWCWGNEPELRVIEYLYGDKIEIRFITGGLVEDVCSLYDLEMTKPEIISEANRRIAEDWIAASAIHGMPIVATNMQLYTELYPSSFPQNIAYHAAKHIDPHLAKRFLRDIREATLTKSKRTSQIDILIELAAESDIDPVKFIDQLSYGNAQADFMHDRMKCRRHGITGFPSYLIKRADTYITLGGYQRLPTLQSAISRLSKGKCRPRRIGPSLANLSDFIKRYKSVYPKEIEVTFGIDSNQARLMIEELIQNNKICARRVGNSLCISYMHPKEPLPKSIKTILATSDKSHHDNSAATTRSKSAKTKDKILT